MGIGSKIETYLKIFDKYEELDQLITIVLSRANGNREVAAKRLGISTRTLHRHIKRRREKDKEQ